MKIKERVEQLKKEWQKPTEIELEIEWPAAEIGGLRFNKQTTKGIFKLKKDGNYYSKDILIHSARETDKADEDTERDLLSEYLASEDVRFAFWDALINTDFVTGDLENVHVFLPKGNQGVKQYNGVACWYWLKKHSVASCPWFVRVRIDGGAGSIHASAVGGVAPAFCVRSQA